MVNMTVFPYRSVNESWMVQVTVPILILLVSSSFYFTLFWGKSSLSCPTIFTWTEMAEKEDRIYHTPIKIPSVIKSNMVVIF